MKRIIYLLVTMVCTAGLFTSCLENVEPSGIEELRKAKAEYYKALAAKANADAELAKANAAATTTLANAEATLKAAEAKVLEAQAAQIDALTAQIEAETARIEAETAHFERMAALDEAIKAAEVRVKEAEAAYWEVYYSEASEVEKAKAEAELVKIQAELDALKLEQEREEADHEEYMAKHEAYMEQLALEAEAAKLKIEAEIFAQQEALLLAKEAYESQVRAYEKNLAYIESMQGTLTDEELETIAGYIEAYELCLDNFKDAQAALASAESDLVAYKWIAAKRFEDIQEVHAEALYAMEAQLVSAQEAIEAYEAEIEAIVAAQEDSEYFEGIPVREWKTQLDAYKAEIDALQLEKGQVIASIADAQITGLADVLDYTTAYTDETLDRVAPAGYSDFNWNHTALSFYNTYKKYIKDQAYLDAVAKFEAHNKDVVIPAEQAKDEALTVRALKYNDFTAAQAAEDAALAKKEKEEKEVKDAEAQVAAAKKAIEKAEAAKVKALDDLTNEYPAVYAVAQSIDLKEYLPKKAERRFFVKFLAVTEATYIESSAYPNATNNYLYDLGDVQPDEYDNAAYIYVDAQGVLRVITTQVRREWVFYGGTVADETHTFGIDGIVKYVDELIAKGIPGIVPTTDADLQADLAAAQLQYQKDSSKYYKDVATLKKELEDTEAAIAENKADVEEAVEALRLSKVALKNAEDKEAKAKTDLATAKTALADAEAAKEKWTTDYKTWLNTGWAGAKPYKVFLNNEGAEDSFYGWSGGEGAANSDQQIEIAFWYLDNQYLPKVGKDTNVPATRVVGASPKAWKEYREWVYTEMQNANAVKLTDAQISDGTGYADAKAKFEAKSKTVYTGINNGRPSIFSEYVIAEAGGVYYMAWGAPTTAMQTEYNKYQKLFVEDHAQQIAKYDSLNWVNSDKKSLADMDKAIEDAKEAVAKAEKDLADAKAAVAEATEEFEVAVDAFKAALKAYWDVRVTYVGRGETWNGGVAYTEKDLDWYKNAASISGIKDIIVNEQQDFKFRKAQRKDYGFQYKDDAVEPANVAEAYYVTLNAQTGDNVSPETIGHNKDIEIPMDVVNYGAVGTKYRLLDNRNLGLILQTYNADFNTVVDPTGIRYIKMNGRFNKAVYFSMMKQLAVIADLQFDIEEFISNWEELKLALAKLYISLGEELDSSFEVALAKAIKDEDAKIKAAKDQLAWEEANLANQQAEAAAANDAWVAAWTAEQNAMKAYNEAADAYLAKVAEYEAALAEKAALADAMQEAFEAVVAKHDEVVGSLIDDINKIAYRQKELQALWDVYSNAYNVGLGTSTEIVSTLQYPTFTWDDEYEVTEGKDNATDLESFIAGVDKYYEDQVKYYEELIENTKEEVAKLEESIAEMKEANAELKEVYEYTCQTAWINAYEAEVARLEREVSDAQRYYTTSKYQLDIAQQELDKVIEGFKLEGYDTYEELMGL
ncbi:MAG: hypothetical protein IKL26_04925 [Bacteroidales bacterium]|nr:hypothetical protein [Bacteroidales bacterium]